MAQDLILSLWRHEAIARKWHALAKRRLDHLVLQYDSGRWRRYYAEAAFQATLQSAAREVEAWQAMIDRDSAGSRPLTFDQIKRSVSRAA